MIKPTSWTDLGDDLRSLFTEITCTDGGFFTFGGTDNNGNAAYTIQYTDS